nr:PAS domain-containing protein [Anaerolineae bacterium]
MRKLAEEREKHLTAVLRVIRNVNQLIVHEKDRDRLLQGACDNLIATRSYHIAWIALIDESGALLTMASAGPDAIRTHLEPLLQRGEWVYCVQQALAQPGTLGIADTTVCGDCPLLRADEHLGRMSIRLEHEGRVFGVLTVSGPIVYVNDPEEPGLLEEITGDIAFALHGIDLEQQRKQAENALAANYQLLRTLVDSLPDRIYAKDFEGRFILKNVADALQMGAASPEEPIGKTDFDYYPPALAEQYDADDRSVIESGQSLLDQEELFITPDGTQGWMLTTKVPLRDAEGNVIGLVGIGRDITRRKQAELQLHELNATLEQRVIERTEELNHAKERIEAILNSSSDVMILCYADGTINQSNPAFDKAFGCTPDSVYGQPLHTLVIPDHISALEQSFETVVKTGRPERLEVIARCQNSRSFDADVMLSPVIASDNRLFAVVCSLRDITERKQLEARLRRLLEHEMELSELKSRYVSMAAHDLRNPLAVIQSTISLIHQYGDRLDREKIDEKYARIKTSISVMVDMLDDILTLGKVESGKLSVEPASLDVIAFCKNLVMEMKQATASQTIDFSSHGDYSTALLDAKLLRHILGNDKEIMRREAAA